MVIRVAEIASAADTAEQGLAVYNVLRPALEDDEIVVISFAGVKTATSSFVNAAFVPLLADFDLITIKRRVRIIESTRQINEMIKSRLERESSAAA